MLMMKFIAHRHRNVLFDCIPCYIRGGAVCGACVASLTPKMGGRPFLSFDNDGELSLSYFQKIPQDCKQIHDSLNMLSSCSRTVSVRHHSASSSVMGAYFYSVGNTHAICRWKCRVLCTITSQETADLKHEVGSVDGSKAAWETLTSQMKGLKGGYAKGKALEALKGLVDQLEPSAGPTDLRLGLACLRLAQSLIAAGEEPSMYLHYAQRALKCFETLGGSWEHALCLYILGSVNCGLQKFDSGVPQLKQCALVLQQVKDTVSDDLYDNFELALHCLLDQVEGIQGNYHESIMHFERAIRIGKKVWKAGSPELSALYYRAGISYRNATDPKIAMCFAQKALEGFMTCYGPSSLQVGKVRALMSGIHCDLKKYEDALLDYNEAKPILEYLKETEFVARMNLDIAELLSYQKKNAAALPLLDEVIKITEVTSELHVTALTRAAVASTELKLKVAVSYYQKAVKVLDQDTSRSSLGNLVQLGLLAEKRAEFEHAALLFQKAMKMIDEPIICSRHSVLVEDKTGKLQFYGLLLRYNIGRLLLRAGKVKTAIPYLQSTLRDVASDNGVQLLIVHYKLGTAYLLVKNKLKASKQFKYCNGMLTEWLHLYLIHEFYKFAIKSRSIDNMGALENMGVCILWFLV